MSGVAIPGMPRAGAALGPRFARAFGLRVALVVVNLATAVLLARLLGPDRYGAYVFALSVMTILALPGQAGVPLILVREISFLVTDRDWPRVLGLVLRARRAALIYATLAAVLLLLLARVLGGVRFTADETAALLWAAALLPGFILVAQTGATLRGLGQLATGQIVETLLRPLMLLLLVAVAVGLGLPVDAARAMALHALGAGLALAAGLWLQRRSLRPLAARGRPVGDTRALIAGIVPFTLIAGVQLILAKTDIVMLRALCGPEEVGHYQVALQAAGLVLVAQQAVLTVTGPVIAGAYRGGDHAAVQATLTSAARVVFFAALPAAAGLLMFGRPLIGLAFGVAFLPAYGALSILLVGRLVQSSYGAAVQLARMLGLERPMLALIAAAAALNLGLNLVFIPAHGIAGAALASIIADFAWKTALVVLARRRFGLISFPLGAPPRPTNTEAA